MKQQTDLSGSMVALVTPMQNNGSIDHSALGRLIDFHCAQGTDAIVAVGTTGESATLSFAEHEAVLDFIIEKVNGRIPLIAGTGANATKEAIHLTTQAQRAGADACLLVTPYYNKPTQEGLYRHYMAIADAVDIPQILYNVPGRTAVDLLPETVQRLASHPCIVGIKEAGGKLQRISELIATCPPNFAVYSGDDQLAMQAMLAGAKGVISVTANIVPNSVHSLSQACLANDHAKAAAINDKLAALNDALFIETNPIPVKWALAKMGHIQSGIRLPLTELSEKHHPVLLAALRQAGVNLSI